MILIKFKSFSQVPGSHDWSVSSSGMLERISGLKLGCLHNLLKPGTTFSTATKFTPFRPLDLYPFGLKTSDFSENPNLYTTAATSGSLSDDVVLAPSKNPWLSTTISTSSPNNPTSTILLEQNSIPSSGESKCTPPEHNPSKGPHSPIRSSPNSLEGDRQDGQARLATLVRSIEAELQVSGIKVDCTELKTQLLRLQSKGSTSDASTAEKKNYLKVDFHYPANTTIPLSQSSVDEDPQINPNPHPQNTIPNNSHQPNPKDRASLFRTQGPSKAMKLCHFPDLQQDGSATIELEEAELNDKSWSHCLVGYFLDGKMPFPLLSSTARKIWKDHGKINIKQVGACFFFEIQMKKPSSKCWKVARTSFLGGIWF